MKKFRVPLITSIIFSSVVHSNQYDLGLFEGRGDPEENRAALVKAADGLLGESGSSQSPVLPASSASIPSGFGGKWGDIFAGASLGNTGGTSDGKNDALDGVIFAGLGLGNPKSLLGLDLSVAITDVKDEFGADGSFSGKIHRQLPWGKSAVSLGTNSFAVWGENQLVPSYYLVASTQFRIKKSYQELFHSLTFHLGTGTGIYSSKEHYAELLAEKISEDKTAHDFSKFGLVAGASVGIIRWLSISGNWNGQTFDAGLSLAPFEKTPIILGLLARDLSEETERGRSYSASLSYSINFFNL